MKRPCVNPCPDNIFCNGNIVQFKGDQEDEYYFYEYIPLVTTPVLGVQLLILSTAIVKNLVRRMSTVPSSLKLFRHILIGSTLTRFPGFQLPGPLPS